MLCHFCYMLLVTHGQLSFTWWRKGVCHRAKRSAFRHREILQPFCNLSQLWFAVYVLLAISHILKIKKLWQSFHMSMPSSKIPWLLSARCRLWGLLQTLLPSGGKRTLLGLSAHGKSHFIIHKPCFLSHVKYPSPLSHCLMDITIGFKISLLFLLLWSCG